MISIFKEISHLLEASDSPQSMEFGLSQPPSVEQEDLICQIISAGLIDQVATLKRDPNNEDPRYRMYYVTMNSNDKVFIHPSSFLHQMQHEWVVYKELVHTTKTYMKGITVIKPEWLLKVANRSLLHFSKPLETPLPWYDEKNDCVKCLVKVTFGTKSWEMPIQEVEIPDLSERARWFARYLLEGKVFPHWKKLENCLVAGPVLITKSLVVSHKRTWQLLAALEKSKIFSKKALQEKWQTNPNFLQSEIMMWISPVYHKLLKKHWPMSSDSQKIPEFAIMVDSNQPPSVGDEEVVVNF